MELRSARHRLEPWTAPDDPVARLARLSARRERLIEDRTRELQRLREDLAKTMPVVQATIKTFESKWVQNLLRAAPTAWHVGRLSAERLVEVMAGAKPPTVERVLRAVKATEAPWLTRATAEDEARAVHQAMGRIALLDKHIAADALTEQLLDEVPLAGRLDAVPGIGQQLATALIVFGLLGTGDRDAAGVRMGAAPVFRGSGTRADGRPKGAAVMRKAAPPRARQMSYMLGARRTASRRTWRTTTAMSCGRSPRGEGPRPMSRGPVDAEHGDRAASHSPACGGSRSTSDPAAPTV